MSHSEPTQETAMAVGTTIAIARKVSVEQAEAFLHAAREHESRTHAIGPIMRPGAYDLEGPAATATLAVAQAFLEFRRTIEQHRNKRGAS